MSDDNNEAGPSAPPSPTLLPLPPLDIRWVHAGTQHLDLLPTPITSLNTTYKAFSEDESFRIEERWYSLSEEERRKAVAEWGASEGEGAPKAEKGAKDKADKAKDKDKAGEKEKDKDKNPAKSMHSSGLREGEVQDRLDGKLPEKEEVFSGQEQAKPSDEDLKTTKYKEIIRKIQLDADLEVIQGIPVSQVSNGLVLLRASLTAGLHVRSLAVDIIAASGILGALWPACAGLTGDVVCWRRNEAVLVGAGRGAREGVSGDQALAAVVQG